MITFVVQKTVRSQFVVEAENPEEAKEKARSGDGKPVTITETFTAQPAQTSKPKRPAA